ADRDSFLAAVLEYADQFTTPNKATKAVGLIKRSVQTGAEMPFELALALERELQAQLLASSDAKEGLNAYGEKRKPQLKGKYRTTDARPGIGSDSRTRPLS